MLIWYQDKGGYSHVLNQIAKTFARSVEYYDAGNNAEAPDGFTVPSNSGRIYLNARSKHAPIFILGHELAHTLFHEQGVEQFTKIISALEDGFDLKTHIINLLKKQNTKVTR